MQSLQTQAQNSSHQPRARDAAWAAKLSRKDLNTPSSFGQAQKREPRASRFHAAVAALSPGCSQTKHSAAQWRAHTSQPRVFITTLALSFSLVEQTQTIYFSSVAACHVVNPAKDMGPLSSPQMWNITQIQSNMHTACVLVCSFYGNLAAKFLLGWTPKNIDKLADTSVKSQKGTAETVLPCSDCCKKSSIMSFETQGSPTI